MALSTKDYLNLSALAYIDFNKSLTGLTINDLIERKAILEDDLNSNPELSALRDSSNPLRSWKLLDFTSTPSSLRAAAFQSPSGEINVDLSSCGESIKRVLIDSTCCITLMFKVKYS